MKLGKFIGFSLSLVMIFSSLNVVFAEDINYRKLYSFSSTDTKHEIEGGYIYFNESTGTITYCDKSVISVEIPSKINGISVTNIGECAFYNCSSLVNIVIPNCVTNIEHGVFEDCNSLTNIIIPNSITSIGDFAFSDCSSLTNIIIPDSVTSIGDFAFSNCNSLTSITIPSSVTSIDLSAFENCNNLTNITIPNSVTKISDLFGSCDKNKLIFSVEKGSYADFWLKKMVGGYPMK